jgi:hypothetical protein
MKLINVQLDGIDTRDYPDFVDAYICYAEHEDGTELTDEELEAIPPEEIYEYVIAHLY